MIARYTLPEIAKVWSDEAKFSAWLEIEILVCEAFAKLGQIPEADVKKIRKNAKFSVKRILEIEAKTKHDVIAFTRNVSESLGEEKKWVHYGLTSSDLVDTSWSILIKQANELIHAKIWNLLETLKELANKYKYSPIMGRTHGVHAEITTFGYKMALWYDILNRQFKRFVDVRNVIEVGMISGAVGNYSNVDPFIQEYVCDKLNLNSSNISSQVLQRDRHASYLASIAALASVVELYAVELRHLQRTEVQEVEESFTDGQKGSSAMPHKKNPITAENITGCARVIRGYMVTAFENVALWHERDISHSSAERIILPDSTMLLYYMLTKMTDLLKNMKVKEERMIKNINATHNIVFSGKVLLTLINDQHWSREKAYDYVQSIALEAFHKSKDFFTLLKKHKCPLTTKQLNDIKKNMIVKDKIDYIFKRLKI